MLVSPEIAIKEEWITHPNCSTFDDWTQQKYISPNAIDFTIDTLYSINTMNGFHISESGKLMRGGKSVTPVKDKKTQMDYWKLHPNSVYDGTSNAYVNIPSGITAMLIIRSSFSRNGIILSSGLYDSGYQGHIGFVIHNTLGPAHVSPGTRIGQIAFFKSESSLMYEGGWNHDKGTHYTDKA